MGRVGDVNGRAWSVTGASVLGAAHARRSLPNQDAFQSFADEQAAVAVVADGHGAPEYVRSAEGARLAAQLLAQELLDHADVAHFADIGAADEGDSVRPLLRDAARRFVGSWQAAVLEHAAAAPFTAAELALLTEDPPADEAVLRAYGTTVLGVAVAADWVQAIAIGDGDIGCVDEAGRHQPMCPLPESIGVQTDSLGAVDPCSVVRTDARRAADVVAVWACTDGFSNAQTESEWRSLVGGQLRQMLVTRTPAQIGADLNGWLEPAAAVGDDTTMVLVLREGLTDKLPQDGKAKHHLLATTLPPGKQRRRGLWRRL